MKSRFALTTLLLVAAAVGGVAVTATAAGENATPASTSGADATVGNVTFTGDGVHRTADGRVFLWRENVTSVDVTVTTANASTRSYDVCVFLPSAPTEAGELGCEMTTIPGNSTAQVTVPVDGWPATPADDPTVEQPVVVRLSAGFYDGVLDRTSAPVRLLDRTGSLDGDDLTNGEEVRIGTDLTSKDTDGDGLWDDVEHREYGTDPLNTDSDGDGLPDAVEVGGSTDPLAVDSDGDGLADGAEVDEYGTNPAAVDSDGDGLGDGSEVVEYGTNPTTADSDGDGLADGAEVGRYGTDPTVADSDGDGLVDGTEINRHGTDPLAVDSDGDGLADNREVRLGTSPTTPLSPWLSTLVVLLAGSGLAVRLSSRRVVLRRRRLWGHEVAVPTLTSPDDAAAAAEQTDGPDGPDRAARESAEADDDTPFFTDRDRVGKLLADGGGYLRQQAIVRATGWSKSKVSRLLSEMAEDGQVTKITVGRENVIALPGHEPQITDSPFEDR